MSSAETSKSKSKALSEYDNMYKSYDFDGIYQWPYFNEYNEYEKQQILNHGNNNYYNVEWMLFANAISLLVMLCLLCSVVSTICFCIGYFSRKFTKRNSE
eukprot:444718_1